MTFIHSGETVDLVQYAELFLTNNITGRRLLRMSEKDLKQMGIASVGHVMDFQVSKVIIVVVFIKDILCLKSVTCLTTWEDSLAL